jgi:hypothetical protein
MRVPAGTSRWRFTAIAKATSNGLPLASGAYQVRFVTDAPGFPEAPPVNVFVR